MRRRYQFWVYIMSNMHHTLYTGMTNDLLRRVYEHKTRTGSGFTAGYELTDLVFYEEHQYVLNAIAREKQIKGWLRAKKLALIEAFNPEWCDLARGWYADGVLDERGDIQPPGRPLRGS